MFRLLYLGGTRCCCSAEPCTCGPNFPWSPGSFSRGLGHFHQNCGWPCFKSQPHVHTSLSKEDQDLEVELKLEGRQCQPPPPVHAA